LRTSIVPEAIDIEPAHFAVVVRAVRQIVEIFDDAFSQGVRVVFDELDDRRLGPEFKRAALARSSDWHRESDDGT
jgi:hypothetical protein